MYKLPQHINSNKIFIINRSELEGRLDAQFYKEAFNFDSFSKLSKYAIVKGGKRIPLGMDYATKETPYLYLRVADIDNDNSVSYDALKSIDKTVFEVLERYEINENDLAISIAGTIGKTILLKNIPIGKRVILTENCAKILIKDNNILPDFFELVLNLSIVQKQIELNYIQTTIPKLGLDRINNLKLPPFPDKSIQQQIVNVYRTAYQEKQQKEAQAQALLASIDDYLLGELGITIPTECEISEPAGYQDFNLDSQNPLVKNGRLFLTRFSEVGEGRLDAKYQQGIHLKNLMAINNGKYKTVFLKDITNNIFQGVSRNVDEKSSFILLKVKNIKQNYEIDYDNTELIGAFPTSKVLRQGDIITPCIGEAVRQIKFSVFIKDSKKYLVDNNIGVIRLNEKANSEFVAYCLCNTIGKIQVDRFIGGGGVPFLGADNLSKFQIPLPPLEKQNKIALHISNIREKAKLLQTEATDILEDAKQKIEQMILGE